MSEVNFTPSQINALRAFEQSNENLFISGPGGTGKSFLLAQFMQRLSDKGKQYVVVAPTGLAAHLINGSTIGSAFSGMGILEGGVKAAVSRIKHREVDNEKLKDADVIIIDEISMVREEVFRVMDNALRALRHRAVPFGGTRVIVFGDFFQLPPVPNAGENPNFVRFSFEQNWEFHRWNDLKFRFCALEEAVRFEDKEYSQLMQVLRKGERALRAAEEKVLFSRIFSNSDVRKISAVRLYGTRKEVEEYNRSVLDSLPGKEFAVETKYSGDRQYIRDLWLDNSLVLKIGSKVLLRKNHPDRIFVNGSTGIVTGIGKDEIEVKLDRSGLVVSVGIEAFHVLNANWQRVLTGFNFPLSLANAMTIHKAQGMTIDGPIVVDLRSAWERSLVYVALSRVKRLSDLHLVEALPQKVLKKSNERVKQFYKDLTVKQAA